MPTTRRSSGGGRPSGKQSTLSFNHRVTKSVPKSAKNLSSTPAKSPLAKHVINAEPNVKDEVDAAIEEKVQVEEPKQAEPEPEREKTEAELRADKITDRQISQYWRDIESERRTKRLHQEDLSLAEKILRYWDVSSQYGPCVGVTRLKRWQRADKLGLNPPVEVLAVLMREEEKGVKGIEKAYMDNILNSTAIGAD
ncbi:DNA polymerase delta, subunit 4-domain-containing protein [Xylaria sp. FL1042]|nr:DNA polymerase delta, subunit 4-domain-containing protein [Xylaria sp. FL1042]